MSWLTRSPFGEHVKTPKLDKHLNSNGCIIKCGLLNSEIFFVATKRSYHLFNFGRYSNDRDDHANKLLTSTRSNCRYQDISKFITWTMAGFFLLDVVLELYFQSFKLIYSIFLYHCDWNANNIDGLAPFQFYICVYRMSQR